MLKCLYPFPETMWQNQFSFVISILITSLHLSLEALDVCRQKAGHKWKFSSSYVNNITGQQLEETRTLLEPARAVKTFWHESRCLCEQKFCRSLLLQKQTNRKIDLQELLERYCSFCLCLASLEQIMINFYSPPIWYPFFITKEGLNVFKELSQSSLSSLVMFGFCISWNFYFLGSIQNSWGQTFFPHEWFNHSDRR